MRRVAVAVLILGATLPAQQLSKEQETSELLEALARSAAIFARSVPGLTARETLSQRARFGNLAVLKQGRKKEIKDATFTISPDFQTHEIVSEYSLGQVGSPPSFHEVRRTLTIDFAPVAASVPMRHALTIGTESADDDTKKGLLEDLERGQLQGAAVDMGPLLLLFAKERQSDYTFKFAGRRVLNTEAALVLRYHQIAGTAAVTEFRERSEIRHTFDGEIWLREADLVPLRITVNTEEVLSTKYTLRNEAEIGYQATPFGLAPSAVVHRQFLNQDLLVENQFRYSDYHGRAFIP